MRILLHYPRHESGHAISTIVLARSVTQIIYMYSQLSSYGYLNPSWPQLKRISVCGQLLILLAASGEIGATEGSQLVRLYVPLLAGHESLWPLVVDMKVAFRQAVQALGEAGHMYSRAAANSDAGFSLPANEGAMGGVDGLGHMVENSEEMAWQSLSLMFDPTCFLSMTHDDLFTVPPSLE